MCLICKCAENQSPSKFSLKMKIILYINFVTLMPDIKYILVEFYLNINVVIKAVCLMLSILTHIYFYYQPVCIISAGSAGGGGLTKWSSGCWWECVGCAGWAG